MKEVKTILYFLATAAYTSSWWALAMFGPLANGWDNKEPNFPLFLLPTFMTIFLAALIWAYLVKNWDDK
jgi:hypothetical protein